LQVDYISAELQGVGITLAIDWSDFRILTQSLFTLTVPPTWRRIMFDVTVPHVSSEWSTDALVQCGVDCYCRRCVHVLRHDRGSRVYWWA